MSENLSQKAYWHIHDKLASGAFQPGLRLSNRVVAKEVGISHTPVREAFHRLVSEGFLEYREGLGVFVPKATRREIEELYEVREMLECAVVSKACGRLLESTLDELDQLQQSMRAIVDTAENAGRIGAQGESFRRLDAAFHVALIRGTGNRQLLETLVHLRRKCDIKTGGAGSAAGLVGHVFDTEPVDSMRRTCREHDRLIELLKDANGQKEACEVMNQHIREGRRPALSAFDRTYMESPFPAARRGAISKNDL
jgi:DNA-binding GntR family transcriptional regulator